MLYVIWGLALMTSLSLPFLPQISQPADSSIFFGRFHIVFLHFPVVLVLLASALILWNYFSAGFQAGRQVSIQITSSLLLLALISVFASVFTGFLLYQGGDYGGKLVTQHLYGGVVLSLLMSGAVYVQLCIPKEKLKQWALLTLLGVSVIVVVFTGHAGGSLTHGEEFLSAYKPLWFAKPTALSTKPQSEILWYEDLVQPILEDKCLSCHNEHKTKGGLLMSNWDNLIKGGKSGKTMLIARVPDSSELYLRTILPLDHDDHMPPTERPQLTSDELFIIHQWIKEGADQGRQIGVGPSVPGDQMRLTNYLNGLKSRVKRKALEKEEHDQLTKSLAEIGSELGLRIEPDPDSEKGLFGVSIPLPPSHKVDDQTISKLKPFAEHISKLSLPGTEITDDAFYDIAKMENLQSLLVMKTKVTGSGLVYLTELKSLKRLNFSFTNLSNSAALTLTMIPTLEEIYLFQTAADTVVVKALKEYMKDTKIVESEGPYY